MLCCSQVIIVLELTHIYTWLRKDVKVSFKMLGYSFSSVLLNLHPSLTLWEPVYDIFVVQFQPKKEQFSVALPTP